MHLLIRSTFIHLFVLAACFSATAQPTTFQVVSKTIEKQLPYQAGVEVNIEGEKAEIIVESWEENEVKVIIELIAKHPDRSIAERDLEAIKFGIDQHGDMIYFRNYISPDNGQPQPEAQLKALYTVYMPNDCPLYLKNHFGEATVSNLTSLLRLQAEFTSILLNDLHGTTSVRTRFGDVTGSNLSGDVDINARRSDITLSDISGNFDITSEYGIIKLFTDRSSLNLNIDAKRSDVYFFDPQPSIYGYTLTAHYGTITAPADLKFNYLENNSSITKAVFQPTNELASISIKISFGDIIIRNP